MEWLQGLFSSAPALGRLSAPGIVLMLIGAALALFLYKIVEKRSGSGALPLLCRFGGLVLACVGALIAVSK